jgi:3-dehydroquinate synthase
MVERCCAIKADIVRQDERESGLRALLNCGHTVGHAIERVLGFGTLRHGEAVAIGLVGESTIAVGRGEAAPDLPVRIATLLSALGLPTRCEAAPEALVAASAMDKKRVHGSIWIAYPAGIGRVRLAEVEPAELLDAAAAVSIPPEDAP